MLKFISAIAVCFISISLHALEIQKVVSPQGITAWLVEDRNLPLLALSASFGKNPDPKGYTGTSAALAGMLDQGAGDKNWERFQASLENLSIEMSFDASSDALTARMRTLTKNKAQAFELLALALTHPTFPPEQIEKIRAQLLSITRAREQSLGSFARERFWRTALGNSPYAFPTSGIAPDIKKIKRQTLVRLHKKLITRANLHISVVGNISAQELGILLDAAFAQLPKGKKLTPPRKDFTLKKQKRPLVLQRESPQSFIYFGLPALKRSDPNFIPYYLLNQILGGGNNSRLYKLARERFGLVYFIHTSAQTLRGGGILLGAAATRNNQRGKLLRLLQRVLAQTRKKGITAKELAQAKAYVIGSYGLNFDTSLAVANNLTYIQREELGIDYVKQRKTTINAVTLEEVNRAAKEILNYDKMIILVAGGKKNDNKTRNLSR